MNCILIKTKYEACDDKKANKILLHLIMGILMTDKSHIIMNIINLL